MARLSIALFNILYYNKCYFSYCFLFIASMTGQNKFVSTFNALTPGKRKDEASADGQVPPPPILWLHCKQKDWDAVRADVAKSDEDRDAVVEVAKIYYEKDLPLHLACRNQAPEDVVRGIINIYPHAVRERSQKDNRLPLVLCVKNKGSYNAVGTLIRAYPEGLDQLIDDKSTIDKSTIRNDFASWGVSDPIKKMLKRSTDDWKVVIEWEEEQKQYGQKVGALEVKLKQDEARIELGEKKDRALLKKIRDLEAKHDAFEKMALERIDALSTALEAFRVAQSAKNTELENDVEMAVAREVVSRQAFKGYTDDLKFLYERTAKASEDLQEQVAEMKVNQALQQSGL